MANQPKDRWDKAEIVLKAAASVIAALTVAIFGYFGSCYLNTRENTEMRTRLYTQLISEREKAESDLRKDMFTEIIGSFLKPDTSTLDASILELELLAYNFHESLILKPLFVYFKNRIEDSLRDDAYLRDQYLHRLNKVAREITRKQMAVLEGGGAVREVTIFGDEYDNRPVRENWQFTLEVEGKSRHFTVAIDSIDRFADEMAVRLTIESEAPYWGRIDEKFTVGFFDFPTIDNTRLWDDQRCAVVLKKSNDVKTDVAVLCFPGSYASLREKPYFNEMIDRLVGKSDKGDIKLE